MPFPRSGTFRSGTFHSGSFRPDAFPPRHFLSRHFLSRHFLSRRFLSRRFPPRHLSAPAFCFAAALLSRVFAAPPGGMFVRERRRSSGWEIARSLWEGKTLGRKKRGARWERGGPLVREGKAVWSEGTPSGAGRCGRWGRAPGCRDCPAWRISGERVPAGPEWRPDNTNRIKNTRFGLSFNEKFGMFVHMNRIRLAEVTLIGHATGSLSGTCAGRGTGGENIWCFMSPAR